jgi:ferrous iron transport protein B
MRIALAGNPNSGKTTLFNALTGAHQRVGNYPGVTVEKKTGFLKLGKGSESFTFEFIDLPGIYGLSAYAMDELVTRNYLLQERPDLIINVVDAANIERNLYLTTQLMELEIPMIVVLNMIDTAKDQGVVIDQNSLSLYLGMPVLSTVGHKNEGVQTLVSLLTDRRGLARGVPKRAYLGSDIEESIT